MQYIGKLDIEKLGKYSEKIITDEVILTEERRIHIYENHTADYGIIIEDDKVVHAVNSKEGYMTLKARSIILAMRCYE